MFCLSNSSRNINKLSKIYFSPKQKLVMQDEGVIKYVCKTDTEKGGGLGQMLTKGGGGVEEMLKLADKGGGLDPPLLVDIFCEQPLTSIYLHS